MSLGPVMLDLKGPELTVAERAYLGHSLAGGVILFERNYRSPEQLEALVEEIHALRSPRLLVAVDQEGGRVQRFRTGFSRLPAPRNLGLLYDENPGRARRLAEACGWLMAAELRAVGVDLSLAPVLDLDRGISAVIGDRAFHADPNVVTDIARAYTAGMSQAGMAATGKHFPGHGSVTVDSHVSLPVDDRSYADIYEQDMVPFRRMIHHGIAAIMPAHVLYPQVDSQPVGFSPVWIRDVLRTRLEFQGAVFSDDLSMGAAETGGDALQRAQAALAAGCDMVLVCNNHAAVEQILAGLKLGDDPTSQMRRMRMHGRHGMTRVELHADAAYEQTRDMIASIV
jgi:beta-N-acetylhexosaminidase